MLLKVQGTEFVRDTNSTALINRDATGLEEYYRKRRMMAAQKNEINTLKEDFKNIKSEMAEIKQLMLKLLEKN